MTCCRKFIVLTAFRQPLPSAVSSFDPTPICPKKDFFDRTPDPQPRAYEPVWPLPLPPNRLTFDIESLNAAASCLRVYLELGEKTYWSHIIVRAAAFQRFLEAMDADQGRTRTLPFSCWCDGGPYAEAFDRQHRHMIVVSPSEAHFTANVWKWITLSQRPCRNFRIKHGQPIQSAMHLVNTLGYLCQRESICEFSGDSVQSNNHYYIFESLPKDFHLPLVLTWEGGLEKLLDQEFYNLKWGEVVRTLVTLTQRKWRMKIKDIPGISFGRVMPVSEDFYPCYYRTDFFFHLLEGKKLFFDRHPAASQWTPETRIAEHAERGNAFYDAVGEETWAPRAFHQKLINNFKPLVERNTELEAENQQLKEQCATLKRKHEESELEARNQIKWLTKKNSELNDTIHQLNKGEIARLKRELASVKKSKTCIQCQRKLTTRPAACQPPA